MPASSRVAAQDATALISGRVVDARTGAPVAGATVSLSPVGEAQAINGATVLVELPDAAWAARRGLSSPQQQRTTGNGDFAFRDLKAGSYFVTATHPNYLRTRHGQSAPDDSLGVTQVVLLAARQQLSNLTLRAWKPSVIEGRVSDETGDPLGAVQVVALRRVHVAGAARYSVAATAETDEGGRYRLTKLVGGTYVVGVRSTSLSLPISVAALLSTTGAGTDAAVERMRRTGAAASSAAAVVEGNSTLDWYGPPGFQPDGPSGGWWAYPPTLHSEIVVDQSSEIRNFDLQLTPARGRTISGIVAGPDGPLAHAAVHLLQDGLDQLLSTREFETAIATTDAGGAFTMLAVPPGNYTLRVLDADRAWPPLPRSAAALAELSVLPNGQLTRQTQAANDPLWWAAAAVTVGDVDVAGVKIELRPGVRARGVVRFEAAPPPPEADVIRTSIAFAPIAPRIGPAASPVRVDAGLRFESGALAPGRYSLEVGAPYGGWQIKNVTVAGRDVYDTLDATSDVDDIVVTMTKGETSVRGSVAGEAAAVATASVLAFPADVEAWVASGMNQAYAVPAKVTAGAFHVRNLRAGDFLVAAIPAGIRVLPDDPDFIRRLAPQATKAALKTGDNQLLPIRLITSRRSAAAPGPRRATRPLPTAAGSRH